MVRSMAPVANLVASMALVGNLDLARIRHHQARRSTPNTPNTPNILSVLRRNRSLVTDPVSDQDMDQTRAQETGRIMGQALVDNPLAGASQDKRRHSGQIKEPTNHHAAHTIGPAPFRIRVSDSIPPMRRVTIHQCAQKQRDARTGIAIWAWMRNMMYPKESLNV